MISTSIPSIKKDASTAEDAIKQYLKVPYAVKTIHGTGHYPMIEKPKEFNALLKETLNEISNGK
ncbi:MAG: alpha/beta hydrolase [Agriterribacter sp.]